VSLGKLKGAAVRGVPLSSTATPEARPGARPAGRGYNEAGAGGVPATYALAGFQPRPAALRCDLRGGKGAQQSPKGDRLTLLPRPQA
jgi:hypothetical protein